MSGGRSRRKGANGENEVRDLIRAAGYQAARVGTGRSLDDLAHDLTGWHLEVKRRETLAIPAWVRQAELESAGRVPIVVYRSSSQPWRAVLPFAYLLEMRRDLDRRGLLEPAEPLELETTGLENPTTR